jgi:hypothetical protein
MLAVPENKKSVGATEFENCLTAQGAGNPLDPRPKHQSRLLELLQVWVEADVLIPMPCKAF